MPACGIGGSGTSAGPALRKRAIFGNLCDSDGLTTLRNVAAADLCIEVILEACCRVLVSQVCDWAKVVMFEVGAPGGGRLGVPLTTSAIKLNLSLLQQHNTPQLTLSSNGVHSSATEGMCESHGRPKYNANVPVLGCFAQRKSS